MAGAVRQLTCDARVVMMRVDSDAKRGVASFDRPRSQVGKCANSIHSPSGGVPGEGEVRAELSQLFEVSLSTTRIDPLLEGLRPSSPDFAALRSTRDGDYNGTIVVP
jgi:hypothetical protein